MPLLFCLFQDSTTSGQVDVNSQRDRKSSKGQLEKSRKFSKCLPPQHNNGKQQMQAITGFERAKGITKYGMTSIGSHI